MSNFKEQSFPMPVHLNSGRLIGPHHQSKLFEKLHVIVILLSLLFCHNALAQREKIDSLKKVLPSLYNGSRIDWLNQVYAFAGKKCFRK